MCSKESHLCEELICEHYGNLVAKVAGYLCRNGWQLLRSIASGTKLKHDQIRKALCVLIQHKLVRFQMRKQIIEYKADIKSIVNLIFYPRMIYTAKLLYGDIAELIVEETLFLGIGLMSEILKRVLDRWQNSTQEENKVDKVQKAFQDLVHTHFLQREPELWITDDNGDDVIPTFSSTKENLYRIPLISENTLKRQRSEENEGEPQAKRQKKCGEVDDDGIYWSINIQRFEQYFRDQAIVSAATRKHGEACGEIVRAMLRISEVTTLSDAWKTQLVSAAEIFRALPPNYTLSAEHINQYLRILSNDGNKIIELVDDSGGGGSYVINFKNASQALATSSIMSYIQERFGSKSCRIFRLLLMKKHLEQKQVEEFAMIPSKEAKEYLYNMLAENMLVMQEIPRTPDHAPSRTFYLFSVNVQKIAKILLIRSYKAITNMIIRRKCEEKSNTRLLEKQERITAIKETLLDADPDQLDEIDEMLTSSERARLAKHEHQSNKLHNAQLQITETVFILNAYVKSLQTFAISIK